MREKAYEDSHGLAQDVVAQVIINRLMPKLQTGID